MNWNRLLEILFTGSVVVGPAGGVGAPADVSKKLLAPASVDELLTYECARSVAARTEVAEQIGPLFSDQNLVFTSVEGQDGNRILVLNAGGGTFTTPLEGQGVNRLRFALPVLAGGEPKVFYLSYLHGGQVRSRYFEYSEDTPPTGRDETDFVWVTPIRAENLLPHLDYAIFRTAEATVDALSEGTMARDRILRPHVENCEHISRRLPSLARHLKINLDRLDQVWAGPVRVRLPASLSASRSAGSGSESGSKSGCRSRVWGRVQNWVQVRVWSRASRVGFGVELGFEFGLGFGFGFGCEPGIRVTCAVPE